MRQPAVSWRMRRSTRRLALFPESPAFDNVPSFVVALDQVIHVEGIGVIRYDLAFDGGAYYAYVDVDVTQ